MATGYATRSSTVTEARIIGPLGRNDMSCVPATTVKDGMTLNLANVEWQVIGTDLVGDVLVPSSYQAVATYSASTSYQVATGYITTAEYNGIVTASGMDYVTYTVVYVGAEIVPEPPQPTEPAEKQDDPLFGTNAAAIGGTLLTALLLAALAGLGVYLFLHRKNVYIYVPGDRPLDYKLIAKFRAEADKAEVDITSLDPYPESIVAVEIKRSLAKKLLGHTFTVHYRGADHTYTVLQDRPGDWHEFDPTEEKEEPV